MSVFIMRKKKFEVRYCQYKTEEIISILVLNLIFSTKTEKKHIKTADS